MSAEDVAALFGVTAAVVGNASSSARSAPSYAPSTARAASVSQIDIRRIAMNLRVSHADFSFCMASYPDAGILA